MADMTELPSSPCQRFTAKVFILEVGADHKRLYVPEAMLRKIEWFSQVIDNFDPTSATINLVWSDPSALSTLFHLVEQGKVPALTPSGSPTKSTALRTQTDEKVHLYVGACAEAARFGMSALEDSLIEAIMNYYNNALVLPEAINILIKGDGPPPLLYDLLLEKMAYDFRAGFYNQRQHNSSMVLNWLKSEHEQAMKAWSTTDLLALLAQIGCHTPGRKRNIIMASKLNTSKASTCTNKVSCTSSPTRSTSAKSSDVLQIQDKTTRSELENLATPTIRKVVDIGDNKNEATHEAQKSEPELKSGVGQSVNNKSPGLTDADMSNSERCLESAEGVYDINGREKVMEKESSTSKRKRNLSEATHVDSGPISLFVGIPLQYQPLEGESISDSVAPSIELEAGQALETPKFKRVRVPKTSSASWERSQTVRSLTPLLTDEEFHNRLTSLSAIRADDRSPTPRNEPDLNVSPGTGHRNCR